MNSTTTKTVGNAATLAAVLETLGIERLEPIGPHEFVVADFMRETGFSIVKSQRVLKKKVDSGELVRRKALMSGTAGYAYSLAKPVAVATRTKMR